MSEPLLAEPCQAVIAVFAYGAERCLRNAVTYVHCEDIFCSAVHPACEQHSTPAESAKRSVTPADLLAEGDPDAPRSSVPLTRPSTVKNGVVPPRSDESARRRPTVTCDAECDAPLCNCTQGERRRRS